MLTDPGIVISAVGGEIHIEEVAGYELEVLESGFIVSIKSESFRFERGQLVKSNGSFIAPKGRVGIVTEIKRPNCAGYSSNVIVVHFEGCRHTSDMKFNNLELVPLRGKARRTGYLPA